MNENKAINLLKYFQKWYGAGKIMFTIRDFKEFEKAISEAFGEIEELRARLTDLEAIATAVVADIEGVMVTGNVIGLKEELIMARKALGVLPEQEQTTTLGMETPQVKFSCGFCAAPLDENKEQIQTDAPEGYNPDDYPKDACRSCMAEQEPQHMLVTREMALDAGDPSLEGQEI